jgi:hypothetical protein
VWSKGKCFFGHETAAVENTWKTADKRAKVLVCCPVKFNAVYMNITQKNKYSEILPLKITTKIL